MADAYLMHHGILGQKWGVRRYQNPDGSYTAAGRKRLRVNNSRLKRNDPINKASEEIQRQTAKGINVSSTQKFVKQAVVSAALITTGVVATKAVLKSGAGKELMSMKMSDLTKENRKGKIVVNTKQVLKTGKSAVAVATAVIGGGALISAGAARGVGATIGYTNYLSKGREGARENKENAAAIRQEKRRSQRRILYD